MLLLLKECSDEIQKIIKNQAKLENRRTGYDMELEQAMTRIDRCIFYHMSKKLDYGDYIVEIRNQGDYELENDSQDPGEFYAYRIVISSKQQKEPQLSYRLSDVMSELGRYNELPTWETLKSFFESEEVKQLFAKYNGAYEQLATAIESESKRR